MNKKAFEINKVRHIIRRKAGRKITERVIPCLFDGELIEVEYKKIKMNGWKEWFLLKQYCSTRHCGKKAILFRTRLAKLMLSESKDDQLTAQYVLWKMITRTPVKDLLPLLAKGFEYKTEIQVEELEALVHLLSGRIYKCLA